MNAIESKIVGYAVVSDSSALTEQKQTLSETTERPEMLFGKTYKIKPATGAAVYVTINDIVVDGKTYPYEIFLASKDVEHQAWMAGMTRVISGVFRKGGEVKFLAEELKAIHDPKGGYFAKGHGFVPSILAHIGIVLEQHLSLLGKEAV